MTDSFQENHSQDTDQSNNAESFASETTFSQPIKVGDRTFSSPEDVIKYYEHSQSFIETLKAEKAQIEGSLTDARKVDDILNKLETAQQDAVKSDATKDQGKPEPSYENVDLDKIVETKLSSLKAQEAREANLNQCIAKAKQLYGEKWASTLDQKAQELGADLKELARANPKLFERAVFGEPVAKPATPTTPSVNKPFSSNPKQQDLNETVKGFGLFDDRKWGQVAKDRFMQAISN